ncbi:helix-turn-helix transcriptional regulator [Ammoniphilus sp. YIM 78166]|uniref:helix-turn-helix transcriptional regulator n=1 Tax=Ammoniphilus sp. YIM 78166 TaxID=1644106 RepID=UPI00106F152A|nr:helix-turn-helix transcriptional regulator [Ammoniphilus sp. YIM 78166]
MNKRNRLIERRKQLGLLQKDVAEAIGCTTSAYGMYETGARTPELNTAKAIADALQTTVDDIFFDDENNNTCDLESSTA